MWPVYQAAIRDLFEKAVTDDEAETMGSALRRILDAARQRQDAESVLLTNAGEKRLGKV